MISPHAVLLSPPHPSHLSVIISSPVFLPPSHPSHLSAIISPQSFCRHLIPHISLSSYLPSLFATISSLTSLCHNISPVFLPPSHPSHLSVIISSPVLLPPSYPSHLSAIISPQSFCHHLIPHTSLSSHLPNLFATISSLTSLCHHISPVIFFHLISYISAMPSSHPSHLSVMISSPIYLPPPHSSHLSAIISPQSFSRHLIPHIFLSSYLPSLFAAISSLISLCHHISPDLSVTISSLTSLCHHISPVF
jgi:hypothetical protein